MMKALIGAVVCAAASAAAAQSRFLDSAAETRKAAEGIVAALAAGNTSGAISGLRPLSVIPATDFDVFEAQVNNQQANLLRQFGNPEGYEFIRQDAAGTRLLRIQFLVFHQNAPIRWTFVFYKAAKGWVISHFLFDGNPIAYIGDLAGVR